MITNKEVQLLYHVANTQDGINFQVKRQNHKIGKMYIYNDYQFSLLKRYPVLVFEQVVTSTYNLLLLFFIVMISSLAALALGAILQKSEYAH